MSFTIELGKTSQPVNALNKKFDSIKKYTGVLKEASSILHPTIHLKAKDADSIARCNYMYIAEFGRYYFIEDVVSERQDYVAVTGRVDVLQTYRDDIRNNSGYVLRCGNKSYYSKLIDDTTLKIYNNPHFVVHKFTGEQFTGGSFVLAVSGSK